MPLPFQVGPEAPISICGKGRCGGGNEQRHAATQYDSHWHGGEGLPGPDCLSDTLPAYPGGLGEYTRQDLFFSAQQIAREIDFDPRKPGDIDFYVVRENTEGE